MPAICRPAGWTAGAVFLFAAVLAPQRAAQAQHGGMATHAPSSPADPTAPASVRWNAIARPLVGGHAGGGMATRPLALLSVAQRAASRVASSLAAADVAVGAASAEVLTFLYPAQATHFAELRHAERATAARRGLVAAAVGAADSIGRAAATRVIARARADGSDAAWRGTVPTTAGTWTSAATATPVGATWVGIRPWVLSTASQFRPAAPAAVGTPAFEANIAEVRQATRGRTPAQLASARKWAEMPLPGYWNGVAAELIASGRVAAPKATEVLAALNVALMDANIACFDAKYAHWSIRPSQADPSIDVPVMLPNFPAYPSGHACLSAAAAEVLAHHFPARRAALDEMAQEVADSRVYAGVHYRVDNDVGMDIGRQVARLVLPAVAAGLDITMPPARGVAR
jgi:hypothetical protein